MIRRRARRASTGDPAVGAGLLVLAPMGLEARAVRPRLPGARVIRTGIGPEAARRLRSPAEAAAVAVVGLCGALDPDLRPGDVVVATEVVGPAGDRRRCSAGPLLAALARLGVPARAGAVATAPRLARGADRTALRERTGALVVDMESAWLAEAANGLPLAVLRAVVDTPARELARPLATAAGGIRALRSLRRAAPALASWAAAGGARRVLLAGPRSFCAGVERAIEIVERALERFGPPVYVRKQIVHNIHVVRDLERRGAVFVEQVDEVPPGATLVFSAHGVSPQVRSEAAERGLRVIDATCPLVTKVHAEARRFAQKGYTIFLIGHEGHEEVEGTTGEAQEAIRLVDPAADATRIEVEDPERVAFLTQTTLAVDEVSDVVEGLRGRLPLLVGPRSDDICYATQNRQDAVTALARECDLMLVIGSGNSSNSKRLVEVAERQGCEARLIDDESELDPAWLAGARTVGVTAGASAPSSLVDRVLEALADLGPIEVEERTVVEESMQFTLPKELRR